jgi:dipeptidyl-peptidase III
MRERDPEFLTIEIKNKTFENSTVLVPEFHLDRSKLMTVGFPGVRDYLLKLNIYKATGDVESAQALFDRLTTVPPDLLYANMLMQNLVGKKSSRRLVVQPNLFIDP